MAPSGAPPPPVAPKPAEVTGPLAALRWGILSAWACRRILVLIVAVNLFLAALVVYPLLGPMNDSLSRHPDAGRIGSALDYRWWTDWTWAGRELVNQSVNALGAAGFAMVLLSTFFAGGLLEALRYGPRSPLSFEPLPDPFYRGALPEWRHASPGPATIQTFLRNCASHFPRFLVYLLLSVPLYWMVQVVLNSWAVIGLDRFVERVGDERIGLGLTILRSALFVIAFDAVTVLFEYVRVQEILKPGSTLVALLGLPLRLLRSRPGTLLGIEAGAFALQVAAMLAFLPIDRLLSAHPVSAVTIGFAASQAFLFARLLIRSAAQAAEIRLAESTG
jgi:hypothetical protein